MTTQATVTKPAAMVAIHANTSSDGGHYHRFETGVSTVRLEDPTKDDPAFNTTSVTFSAGTGTITPTLPSNIKQLHVLLTNGHYYRFESSGQVTALQNGDVTGSFATINFTTA